LDAYRPKETILGIRKAIQDVVQWIWFQLQDIINLLLINIMQIVNSVMGVALLKVKVFELILFQLRNIFNLQGMKTAQRQSDHFDVVWDDNFFAFSDRSFSSQRNRRNLRSPETAIPHRISHLAKMIFRMQIRRFPVFAVSRGTPKNAATPIERSRDGFKTLISLSMGHIAKAKRPMPS
jgi:hypothetical protein